MAASDVYKRQVLAFLLDNIGNPFSARNISGRMVSEGIKTTTATAVSYTHLDVYKRQAKESQMIIEHLSKNT